MRAADRCSEAVARGQHGHLNRDQCKSCGHTDRSIDARVRAFGWKRVLPGVFRLPGVAQTTKGWLQAALLWAKEGSMLYGTSAAFAYGLDGIEEPNRAHVATHRNIRHESIVVHRLSPDDRPRTRVLDGLRVPTIERVLLDLGAQLPPRVVGEALDDALRRQLTTLERMWNELRTTGGKGRKGTKIIRRLLEGRDDRDGRLRSKFEAKMLRILRRITTDLAVPDFLVTDGARRYKIDFAYPSYLFGIECQGLRWHHRQGRLVKDHARDRWLKSRGWTLIYYTWDDVVFRSDEVEAEIRAFLTKFSRLSTRQVGGGEN